MVRRQRAGGRQILLRYPINTTVPLPPSHVEVGLHLVYGTLDGRVADASSRTPRFWWAATTTVFAGRLSECVQHEASVSQALTSFLHLDEKSGDEVGSCCGSSIRTHSDPNGNITRRHQFGPKRPSSSDTRNQDDLETSSRESWTSHQRRSDQVFGCGRRHSCGPMHSERFAMFNM